MKKGKGLLNCNQIPIIRKKFRSLDGSKPEKEFVLCYSDDHKILQQHARFNAKPNFGFGFAAASAVLAALKQVLTRSLP